MTMQVVLALGQVVNTDVASRALVQALLLGDAHEGGVTTVTGAVQADAVLVGDALFDRPFGGIGQVVLHRAAPFTGTRVQEGSAVTAGTSIVELQHRVTGRRQHLRLVVEFPFVVDAEGTAVRHHHQGKSFAGAALGCGQVTVQRQPVARRELDRLHLRLLLRVEPLPPSHDMRGLLGHGVEQVEVTRIAIVGNTHQGKAAIGGLRRDHDVIARKGGFQATLQAGLG